MQIPTPLLHVNKEIREFAMKWYPLSFAEQQVIPVIQIADKISLFNTDSAGRLKGKAIFFDFNRDTLRFSLVESLERFCGTSTTKVPESQLAHRTEIGGKVRFLETHNSFRSTTVGLVSRFYNLDLLTSNYEPKPWTEKFLIKHWTMRAKENGREVEIPKYRLKGGVTRQMSA